MRKLLLITILPMLFCLISVAQVSFTPSIKQTKDEITISFSGKIDNGWHIYGQKEKNGPIPTTFNITKKKGVEILGSLEASRKPTKKFEEMFGAEVSYYEGNIIFSQKLKLTGDEYLVEGYLEYGACNDQSCLPPTSVEFSYKGSYTPSSKTEDAVTPPTPLSDNATPSKTEEISEEDSALSAPQEASTTTPTSPSASDSQASQQAGSSSLWTIFLLGILGGFVAILTPCVWPIIPMTVSFFMKRGAQGQKGVQGIRNARGIRDAVIYGISIIVIYLSLGLIVTGLFGASALNALSTNAFFNIFFFLLLIVFGASLLGAFEMVLPSRWVNAVDSKASEKTGLISIFLMAFTLVLVSFSCTAPIIGFLLVELGTSGNIMGAATGMLGFAVALALPFMLFAIFPTWLKAAPKSGNWMNSVKVTLGFVEIAFSLKFLSVADLAYGWHILDREVFLCLWIVLFFLLGCYLIGWIRFPHDVDEYDEAGNVVRHTSPLRFFAALCVFAFTLYMVPGLWGAPCKAISAFAPPMSTQTWKLSSSDNTPNSNSVKNSLGTIENPYRDYDEGIAAAKAEGKPVMIDFTGYGCVNCRKMEAAVWTDDNVQSIIDNDYILIQLFVDDKTSLPETVEVTENGQKRNLRTVGDKWSYLQRSRFGHNTQPFYVLIDPRSSSDDKPALLTTPRSYDEDIDAYTAWLKEGLAKYSEK